MNKPPTVKLNCRRLAADLRRHPVPILTAVILSRLLESLGMGVTVLFAAGSAAWIAWRTGWRIQFTKDSDGTNPKEDPCRLK